MNYVKDCKKALERYQNLYNEEKEKKQQHGRERYKNLSKYEKRKLVEYSIVVSNKISFDKKRFKNFIS